MSDDDRNSILARRRLFVARALGGLDKEGVRSVALAATTLSLAACPKPQVCLNMPPYETEEGLEEDEPEQETEDPGPGESETDSVGTETGAGSETDGSETDGSETGGSETGA